MAVVQILIIMCASSVSQYLVFSLQSQRFIICLFSCSSQSIWELRFCSSTSYTSVWTAAALGHQDGQTTGN